MNPFHTSGGIENQYARQLRKIATEVGRIITGYDFDDNFGVDSLGSLFTSLLSYSEIIKPWAARQANIMLGAVEKQNRESWRKYSAEMSEAIKRELRDAPTGIATRELLARNVGLITSLPIEAGERVGKIVTEGLSGSARASSLVPEIMRSGEVTKSRATLIARTETSRAKTTFTQIRAQAVGSTHFQWNTVHDSDVRPMHKALDGKLFPWNAPPECDPGQYALPGSIWNCRCLALPILPDELPMIGHNSRR